MIRYSIALLLLVAGSALAQQTTTTSTSAPPAGSQPAAGAGAPGQYNLAAFRNITSCLPFNVVIAPSGSNSYTMVTSVSPDVDAALRVAVANNTLYLGFNKSFETTGPIRVTVSLPADKLQVVQNKGVGSIIINPGFNVSDSVSLKTSSGSILARGLNTSKLSINVDGTTDVFARGAIGTADVRADGTSTVTLSGVTQAVTARLQGISNLYLDAASDNVVITPTVVDGLSKVYYNKGKGCDDQQKPKKKKRSFFDDDDEDDFFDMGMDDDFFGGGGIFGGKCSKVTDPEDYPVYRAMWSCGLKVKGAAVCVPGDEATQAAALKAAVISVAAANTANTAAPNTPPPATTTGTPGGNAAATKTATTATPGATSATAPNARPAAQLIGSPLVDRQLSASEIKVAAAGRKLHSADMFVVRGPGSVSTSSSSSSSSRDGRRQQAVAVASLDCAVPDTELYINA